MAVLGLLAGMCGKAFTTPTFSGSNLYLVLVADSGTGKEALHEGITSILQQLPNQHRVFAIFSDAASAPALTKVLARQPSFVHVNGEFGHRLKRLADPSRDPLMQQMRRVLTNLYSKSGPNSMAGGLLYSDEERNVEIPAGVAYSLVGETTPDTFFDSLTEDMMADGFMSRFIVVDYSGPRQSKNLQRDSALPPELRQRVGHLAQVASQLNRDHQYRVVQADAGAHAALDRYEASCDANVNLACTQSVKQLWNRAHLKVLRVASLLAVADQHEGPLMTLTHVNWSIQFVERSIGLFLARLERGDVGSDDHTRAASLANIVRRYIVEPAKDADIEQMRGAGFITSRYLHQRVSTLAPFRSHKNGSTFSFKQTIQSFIDSGYLMEVSKEKAIERFSYAGKVYRIVDLPE